MSLFRRVAAIFLSILISSAVARAVVPSTAHDIAFVRVPEINPAWSAVASCLLVGILIIRHRADLRKK